MTFEQAIDALEQLGDRAVEIDTFVVRGSPPGLQSDGTAGVLRRAHPSEWEEFWWTLPEAAYFDHLPVSSFAHHKAHFRSARWQTGRLTIDMGAYLLQVIPLVRPASDGSLNFSRENHSPGPG